MCSRTMGFDVATQPSS
uniref:Uncharacterized protein n=2 Tax=Oryza TaxID=4527 RepID=A0A0D3GUY8_9ORYZ